MVAGTSNQWQLWMSEDRVKFDIHRNQTTDFMIDDTSMEE
jgi:hypothetical protein